jgi:vancomycin resistance protein VanJ
MVTCRELVIEVARVLVTAMSWLYGSALALYLFLRLVIGDDFWLLAVSNMFVFFLFVPLLPLVLLGIITWSKRGLVITVPLALIGLVWFGSYYLPRQPAPPGDHTLWVVTFNVYQFNPRIEATLDWLNALDADLVFLQEVPQSHMRLLLSRLSARYPYQAVRNSPTKPWANVFLSRYAILEKTELDRQGDGTPNTQQRYLLDVNDRRIAVYNVDMAFPSGPQRFTLPLIPPSIGGFITRYDDRIRNMQIRRLVDHAQAESLPFIIAGDFNMSDQSIIYGDVSEVLHDAFRSAATGLGATWPVGGVEAGFSRLLPPVLRLDYIWHGEGLRAFEAGVGPALGSDHLPVYAGLDIQ